MNVSGVSRDPFFLKKSLCYILDSVCPSVRPSVNKFVTTFARGGCVVAG